MAPKVKAKAKVKAKGKAKAKAMARGPFQALGKVLQTNYGLEQLRNAAQEELQQALDAAIQQVGSWRHRRELQQVLNSMENESCLHSSTFVAHVLSLLDAQETAEWQALPLSWHFLLFADSQHRLARRTWLDVASREPLRRAAALRRLEDLTFPTFSADGKVLLEFLGGGYGATVAAAWVLPRDDWNVFKANVLARRPESISNERHGYFSWLEAARSLGGRTSDECCHSSRRGRPWSTRTELKNA